jgi:hypothetical protein
MSLSTTRDRNMAAQEASVASVEKKTEPQFSALLGLF